MYESYFQLSENPFSIAPNPQFLYMSERHREALAHLMFGLRETGGFVMLTGEVGTGKTTVSRRLLKELPEHTDLAFILNPMLTETELLASLCDELKIPYPDQPSLKQLTDVIQAFLLENHQKGRQTVLLVDEAQHLKVSVLEQLRLLTNLETDTQKLLKVILIGQPELNQLLRRRELRQLSQRITARYHLLPLGRKDTGHYVRHRLRIAGREAPLFTGAAIRALHRHSGGIPRLINLLCDRALLGAYGLEKDRVDSRTLALAAREVLQDPAEPRTATPWLGLAAGAALGATALFFFWPGGESVQPAAEPPAAAQTLAKPAVMTVLPGDRDRISLAAFDKLFRRWGMAIPTGEPCQQAQLVGLRCLRQHLPWRELIALGRPAVLELLDDSGERFYGLLDRVEDGRYGLRLSQGQYQVDANWLDGHYRGQAMLLWQPPAGFSEPLAPGMSGPLVDWLAQALSQVDGEPALASPYDARLLERVRRFQARQGLKADGLAGENTLVRLNMVLGKPGPTLEQNG
ncbi:AAA family ATPase [Gallaecimonas sp. GXIMD4217]|uniref:ExeA family protein n=1 Tax=Gallaecimonas sp. GXIMD4217 TaxID=3131927 RepID=UPI00311B3A3D